jgi:MFS family permease
LWAAVFFGYLAFGATMQELPGYVVGHFHQGTWTATVLVGIAFAATALARPFVGRGGDAGYARRIVLAGGLLAVLGAVGQLLAPSVLLLAGARLVMGAGEAALFSAALPWVIKSTPSDRRGRVTGWFGLSMWAGLAIGPLLAVAASQFRGPLAVWYLVIALPVVSTVVIATTRQRPPVTHTMRVLPSSWRDLVPAGTGIPGTFLGLGAFGYGTISVLAVLYLTASGIGGQNYALAIFAAGFLIFRFLGSPLIDRLGARTIGRISAIIAAIGLLGLALASAAPLALAGAAVAGAGLSLFYPSATGMALLRTDPSRIGATAGATTSFWDLGVLCAGLTSGAIADAFPGGAAFLVASAACAVAVIATFAVRKKQGEDGAANG